MKRWLARIQPSHFLITVMSVIAATSLYGVMRGQALILLAIGGAVVALVAMLIADRLKLPTPEWVALTIGCMIVFGGIAAGTVPLPGSYSTFFRGLVNGWADLLSSVPRVAIVDEYRVLPYVLSWIGASIGFGLLRHIRIPGFAALGPIGGFALGLMFSTEVRSVALIQGALLASLALALGFYQQRDLGFENDQELGNTTIAKKRTRLLGAGAMLLLVAGLSPVLANFTPGFDERDRFDLRDRLEPPWNALNEPSPLASIRGNYLDENKDNIAFIATGEHIPDRWSLAVLAAYDGTVWTVGDSGIGGEAPFVPLDTLTPADPWRNDSVDQQARSTVSVEVEIVGLDGPWLPTPGRATEIQLEDVDGLIPDLRFNQRTGTAVAPDGASGLSYLVEAVPTPLFDTQNMKSVIWGQFGTLTLEQQAAAVLNESADVVEGVEAGWAQVEAISSNLTERGFYLATAQSRPGHSWARLADFSDDETLYGNEEQYVALAAIMARNANIPTRVVVGYDLNGTGEHRGTVEVTNDEATAWIEVLTVEFGWVPVNVTPDRDKEPTLEDSGTRTEPVAAPNPPPPPPPPPELEAETPDELEEDEEDELDPVDDEDEGLPGIAVAAIGATAVPLGTFGLWTTAVVGLKARRRRRRRGMSEASDRVSGAWFEANDRLHESGFRQSENLSVIERARFASNSMEPGADGQSATQFVALAHAVDQAAFGKNATTEEAANTAWVEYDGVASELRGNTSIIKRMMRAANPATLLKRNVMKSNTKKTKTKKSSVKKSSVKKSSVKKKGRTS